MLYKLTIATVVLLLSSNIFGQRIEGSIIDSHGSPLSYASVYVVETGLGTISDDKGDYHIELPNIGSYSILVRHLGYEPRSIEVEAKGDTIINFILKAHNYFLNGVTVIGDKDLAKSIMSKVIAKSEFYQRQIDSFHVDLYLKGRGKMNPPKLLNNLFRDGGIDSSRLFIYESLSEISYVRPDRIDVSINSVYRKNAGQPIPLLVDFIPINIYEDDLFECLNPISVRGLKHYKFDYNGEYFDGDQRIHIIGVKPRTKGRNRFEGSLLIVDEVWSVSGLDLAGHVDNTFDFDIDINLTNQELEDNVWMPEYLVLKAEGKALGIGLTGEYLYVFDNYKVHKNPRLDFQFILSNKPSQKEIELVDLLSENPIPDTFSFKELDHALSEFDKSDPLNEHNSEDRYSVYIDTNAYKIDSVLWAESRPFTLTQDEQRGYDQVPTRSTDSKLDSSSSKFTLASLISGYYIRDSSGSFFDFSGFIRPLSYNLVDGIRFGGELSYYSPKIQLEVDIDYGLESRLLQPSLSLTFSPTTVFAFNFGAQNSLSPFSNKTGISEFPNSLFILLGETNHLNWIHQRSVNLGFNLHPSSKILEWKFNISHSDFGKHFNSISKPLINFGPRQFLANNPYNIEQSTIEDDYLDFTLQSSLLYRPCIKCNSFLQHFEVALDTRLGLPNVLNSTSDYLFASLALSNSFDVLYFNELSFKVEIGSFINNDNIHFVNFHHFTNNPSFIVFNDNDYSFRVLPSYTYSTVSKFMKINARMTFDKLLLTQFTSLQLWGLSEYLIMNTLNTPFVNYIEGGYGLKFHNFFKVEFLHSFGDISNFNFKCSIGL